MQPDCPALGCPKALYACVCMSESARVHVSLLARVLVALLRWLNSQTEEDRRILAAVTGVQVGRELLNRITGQDKVDAYKRDCVLSIAQFLRQNPRASQAQINAEVEKNVLLFAARVKALETAPIL
uniref:Si:ch211-191j22.3 n=1 Tax=Oreochromis niloticus TaxID=8128 RepID=A0A669B6T7_ORENI